MIQNYSSYKSSDSAKSDSKVNKLKQMVKRVNLMKQLGVTDLLSKLQDEEVSLAKDIAYISIILQKENDRQPLEINFLQKAFAKMKFFTEQKHRLQPDIYNQLFEKVQYSKKKAMEILFHYGQKDHRYYIVLSGEVLLLVPNQDLLEEIRNEETNPSHIKRKTRLLLSRYYKRINQMKEYESQKEYYEKQEVKETFDGFIKFVFPDFDCVGTKFQGDSFGEMACMNRKERTATVVCKTDCEFMTLDADSFDLILRHQERNLMKIKYQFLNKLEETYQLLESKKNDLIHAMKVFHPRMFDVIYREGDEELGIYYVNQGEVELSKKCVFRNKHQVDQFIVKPQIKTITTRISLITTGCVFGKEDVINKQSRSLTATAHSRLNEVFFLPKLIYFNILKKKTQATQSIIEIGSNPWKNDHIQQVQELCHSILQQQSQEQISVKFDQSGINEVSAQVNSREQISFRLKLQLNPTLQLQQKSKQSAFMTDREIKKHSTSLYQRLNVIKEGFFFAEPSEFKQKQLSNKKVARIFTQSNITLRQNSISPLKIRFESRTKPESVLQEVTTRQRTKTASGPNIGLEDLDNSMERKRKRVIFSRELHKSDRKKISLIRQTQDHQQTSQIEQVSQDIQDHQLLKLHRRVKSQKLHPMLIKGYF